MLSYVPPNSIETYLSSLLSYLTVLTTSYKCCIFVGDLNFPDIDWFSLLTGCSSLSNSFVNLFSIVILLRL